jgi:N-acetylglucosamine kinase-like BadF-type ATPase
MLAALIKEPVDIALSLPLLHEHGLTLVLAMIGVAVGAGQIAVVGYVQDQISDALAGRRAVTKHSWLAAFSFGDQKTQTTHVFDEVMSVFSGDLRQVIEVIERRQPAAAHYFFQYSKSLGSYLVEG